MVCSTECLYHHSLNFISSFFFLFLLFPLVQKHSILTLQICYRDSEGHEVEEGSLGYLAPRVTLDSLDLQEAMVSRALKDLRAHQASQDLEDSLG